MTHDAPLVLHRESVREEWIDYNNHMNVAYYVLAFDHATDAFFDYLGLDDAYREATGGSTFAAETHVTYQREVHAGDPLRFTTQLLDHDSKRLHFMHHMYHEEEGFLAATSEWLGLHIDLTVRRVSAMPPEILARVAEVAAAHGRLPAPPEAGRVITVPKVSAA